MNDEEWWPSFGIRKLKDLVADFDVIKRRYINRENQVGNTPLHLASSLANHQSIKYLLACDQIDPSILNEDGRPPLSELLSNIDVDSNEKTDESIKISFNLLFDRINPMWLWSFLPNNTFKNTILTKQDVTGNTALHYAAMISDPYFYNKLKPYMDEPIYNKQNQTPEDLRK